MNYSKVRKFNNLKFIKVPTLISVLLITACMFLFMFYLGTGNQKLLLILLGLIIFWFVNIFKLEQIIINPSNDNIVIFQKGIFWRTKISFPLHIFKALRIVFSIDKPIDNANSNFGASPNWGKVQYKSFDLFLVSEDAEIKIRRFTAPAPAQLLQKELSNELNKPIMKPIRIFQKE